MNLNKFKPDVRYLNDLKDVLYEKKRIKTAPNVELYYVYRDLADSDADWMKIIKYNLRYDMTIMRTGRIGKEFNKTAGHDHPVIPGTSITYPEIYSVLEGKAIFLLQNSENDKILDIKAIKAGPGDKIIVPPNYEHLIINIGKKNLKTCNWIARTFSSNIYKPFKMRNGFGYYALKGLFGIKWVKNKNYKSIPKLKFEKPNNFYNFYIFKNETLYDMLKSPSKLDFLNNPQKYKWS